MLLEDVANRLSSVKLAFLMRCQCLAKTSNSVQGASEGVFAPYLSNERILYPLLPYYYIGATQQQDRLRRHDEGRLCRLDNDEVVYDGSWNNDVPEGFGAYRVFGDFVYQGVFRGGAFVQQGHVVYCGATKEIRTGSSSSSTTTA